MNVNDKGYEDWLKSLKVGDIVAYDSAKYSSKNQYVVSKIAKVTLTGRITLENGMKFNNQGLHREGEYTHYYLEVYTEKIQNTIDHNEMIQYMRKVDWNKIPFGTLKNVIELVKVKK